MIPLDLERSRRRGAPNKLAHVVFKTPRIAEMIDWYTTVLDAVVVFADKRIAFLTYDQEHHRIALIKVPRPLRIPGAVWKVHRKFFGVDHIAFTYEGLADLIATHRRLADAGIEPVWCINHGPTTSMYYEDPDGNRIELQVDNFATNRELLGWLAGGEFDKNPRTSRLREGPQPVFQRRQPLQHDGIESTPMACTSREPSQQVLRPATR